MRGSHSSRGLVSQNTYLEDNGDEDHKERDKFGDTVSAGKCISAGKVSKMADSTYATDNSITYRAGSCDIGCAVAQP